MNAQGLRKTVVIAAARWLKQWADSRLAGEPRAEPPTPSAAPRPALAQAPAPDDGDAMAHWMAKVRHAAPELLQELEAMDAPRGPVGEVPWMPEALDAVLAEEELAQETSTPAQSVAPPEWAPPEPPRPVARGLPRTYVQEIPRIMVPDFASAPAPATSPGPAASPARTALPSFAAPHSLTAPPSPTASPSRATSPARAEPPSPAEPPSLAASPSLTAPPSPATSPSLTEPPSLNAPRSPAALPSSATLALAPRETTAATRQASQAPGTETRSAWPELPPAPSFRSEERPARARPASPPAPEFERHTRRLPPSVRVSPSSPPSGPESTARHHQGSEAREVFPMTAAPRARAAESAARPAFDAGAPSPWPELAMANVPAPNAPRDAGAPRGGWPELLAAEAPVHGLSSLLQERERRRRLDQEQRGE